MSLPSCRQAALLLDILLDSQAGKQELATYAPGKWEVASMPVEVVFAHSKASARFFDRQQFVGT
jgi:hypothetical protein